MRQVFFCICTPLQYLNAVEARALFNDSCTKFYLVVFTDYDPSLLQINKLIDNCLWDDISFIKKRKSSRIKIFNRNPILFLDFYYRANKLIKFIENIKKTGDLLVVGNINEVGCLALLSRWNGDTKYLLDDGQATVSFVARKNSGDYRLPATTRRFFTQLLFKIKKLKLNELVFFTSYKNLDFSPAAVILNDYKELRKTLTGNDFHQIPKGYFVGQDLPGNSIISESNYLSLIDKIRVWYIAHGFEFQYLVHRSEDLNRLPQNWNAIRLDIPIELHIAKSRETPSIIGSIQSSALLNLKQIFGTKLNLVQFSVPANLTSKHFKYKSEWRAINNYIAQHTGSGFKIVDARTLENFSWDFSECERQ